MNERIVCVRTYDGISFSLEMEGNSGNMDEPWLHDAKWQPVAKGQNTVWFQLHDISRVVRFKERESRMVISRCCVQTEMGSFPIGIEFQFGKMKKAWKFVVQQYKQT